jgi:hypothetical protein
MTVIAIFCFLQEAVGRRRRRRREKEEAHTHLALLLPTYSDLLPQLLIITPSKNIVLLYMEALGLACMWVLTDTHEQVSTAVLSSTYVRKHNNFLSRLAILIL